MKKHILFITLLLFISSNIINAEQLKIIEQRKMAPVPTAPTTKTPSKTIQNDDKKTENINENKVLDESQFKEMMEQKKKLLSDQMSFFLVELFEKQMEEYKKANEQRKKAEIDRIAASEERKKAEFDRIAAAEERKKAFEDEKRKVEEDKKIAAEMRNKAEEERKKDIIERKNRYIFDYELYKQEKYINLIIDGKIKHPQIITDVIKYFEGDTVLDSDAKDVVVKKLKSILSNVDKKEISIEDGINLQKYNKWLDTKSKLMLIVEEKEKGLDTMKDISKYINNDSDVDGKNKEKVLGILRDSMNAVSK